jgi:hypothetical protein
VLRKIFGPKRYEVTREWRRLYNQDFHDLYSSPNIIWVIKSRRMQLGGEAYSTYGGGEKACTGFWQRNMKERDLSVDERIILK